MCPKALAALLALVAALVTPGHACRAPTFSQPDDSAFQAAKKDFLRQYKDYGYRGNIDDLFDKEVAPRLPHGEHYLDYTGSTLPLNSQLHAALQELESGVFGNPHSTNPSSARTEAAVEAVRSRLLAFLGADPEEYDLVFTRSGTGALRELGETFPWARGSRFAWLTSNHNSVLGIREYARQAGAEFGAVTEEEVEAWLAAEGAGPLAQAASSDVAGSGGGTGSTLGLSARLPPVLRDDGQRGTPLLHRQLLATSAQAAGEGTLHAEQQQQQQQDQQQQREAAGMAGSPDGGADPAPCLFAYPAYDNYAGIMYPLRWVRQVQARSDATRRWRVLLDAAAFLPTHQLNLTETPADFVVASFYKLFGFPTGVGALVARKSDISAARKVFWGGGSVFLATSTLDWKHFRPSGPERFEDGTLNFLSIMSLQQGLDKFAQLGGPAAIERHTSALRSWLYDQLTRLRHSNGAPLLHILGRHHWPDARSVQGATINMQLLRPDGKLFSYRAGATALDQAGFSMRCGCTCNPGACYGLLGVRDEEVRAAAEAAHGNFSDWEWVWVHRPEAAARAGGDTVPDGGTSGSGAARRVRLPLGSLRASLGWMARFEDAWALASFIKAHWTDRADDATTAAPAEVAASLAAAGLAADEASAAALLQKRRHTWSAADLNSPGWC